MQQHKLKFPLSEKVVRGLKIGDEVYVSGKLYEIRGPALARCIEYANKGKELPFSLKGSAVKIGYTFIVQEGAHWRLLWSAFTTSAVYNRYYPDFIRKTGIRAIISKGELDTATPQAMQECGCVYMAGCGGCSPYYSRFLDFKNIYWQDLGINQVYELYAEDFGPCTIAIDANGNSMYEVVKKQVRDKLPAIYERLKGK